MKKVPIVLFAALAMMASPALAEIVYTPQLPDYDFGVGVFNPADPLSLNTVYVTSGSGAPQSATFQFTFAIHANAIFYNANRLHFSFAYDNSSLEVLGMQPVGPWQGNNYAGQPWPNSSHGIIAVNSLSQFMTETSAFVPFDTSVIVPFMHVTLHVKSAQYSQVNAFGITLPGYGPLEGYGMTLTSHTFALTLFPESFAYFGGAVHEIPEPASMTLVGGLLAAFGGRLVRRKGRAA